MTPEPTLSPESAARFCRTFAATLALTLLLAAGLNVLVDPFGFQSAPLYQSANKAEVAYLINKRIATLAKVASGNANAFLLGDSRGARLDANVLGELTGHRWANLAFGGATVEELDSVYRYVRERREVRALVLVVPFNRLTRTHAVNGVDEAARFASQPWKLYASLFCLRASAEVALSGATGMRFRSDEPPMPREQFLRYQLAREAENFVAPEAVAYAARRVTDIVVLARRDGAEVLLVAPPAHPDVISLYESRFPAEFGQSKRLMDEAGPFLDLERAGFEREAGGRVTFKDALHLDAAGSEAVSRAIAQRLQER